MARAASLILTLGAAIVLGAAARPAAAAPQRPALDADSLQRRALARMAQATFDARRLGVADLDEASRLAPRRADIWSDLARACHTVGQVQRARDCLERAANLAPEDGSIQLAVGLAWQREWMASTDTAALSRATSCLIRAAKWLPRDPGPRLALAAIALYAGNVAFASAAARSALACEPEGGLELVGLGCVAYREGNLARADSAFRAALPRLPPAERARLTDVGVIGGEGAGEAFWRRHDPDLTTRENEAELNFLARAGHAVLLFRDAEGLRWDVRADLFVRYGIPSRIDLHDADSNPQYAYKRGARWEHAYEYAPAAIPYPYAVQTWTFEDLGIRTELWDKALRHSYELPINTDTDPDPRPHPAKVRADGDLLVLGEGLGVYRKLPPGVSRMEARAMVSRFPGEQGSSRVVVHLDAPGEPGETITGSWALVTRDGREVARGSGAMSISSCDPTRRRVADFSAEVAPGDYRIDASVTDGRAHRGVVHLETGVPAPAGGLALSDVVILCGAAATAQPAASVRVEPEFDRTVRGDALAVYFEVAGLTPGPDGLAPFSYTYRVTRWDAERSRQRGAPVIEVSRQESNVGSFRRQYINAPLRAIARGDYQLEIEVQDMVSGRTATGTTTFVRD